MSKIPQSEILPLPTDVGALANRINSSTKKEHNKIDKSVTIKFAVALRDAKIYRQGLQGFYHVFKTVEVLINKELAKEPKTKVGEILSQFWDEEAIARTSRLEQDLLFFYGNDKNKFEDPIRQEQINFVKHIYETYEQKPHILLAYCHVMYLALFAGGQILSSSLAKATGIFPQVDGKSTSEVAKLGTNFFKFPVEDSQSLRIKYKREFELATRNELTEQEKLDIIEEAKEIFRRNYDVVAEIEDHNRSKIQGKLSFKVLTYGPYVVGLLGVLALYTLLRRFI
jgi:heme oxygenase